MASKNKRAVYPIHPGTILADELAEWGETTRLRERLNEADERDRA